MDQDTDSSRAKGLEIISSNFDYSWEACLKNFGYHGRTEEEKVKMDWWKRIVKSVYIHDEIFIYFSGISPFMSHFSKYFNLEFRKEPDGYPTLYLRKIPQNSGFKLGERII